MPIAYLGATLAVSSPGPHRGELMRLATFQRQGRVPPGERREAEAFTDGRTLNPPQDVLWLPRGLWPEAQRRGVRITDRRRRFRPIDFGWRGSLRSYQWEAASAIGRQHGGLLMSPPGSGKTVMGLALVALWRQPATWLVHTRDLARQARERAERLFNLPPSAVGYVGEGQPFDPGSHLTIAMVQSLVRRRDWCDELGRRSGTVILDEFAHAPAATFRAVLSRFPACYRAGLGATLSRSDGLGEMAKAVLGPGMVRVPLELLVRQGWVLRPVVVMVPTGFTYQGDGSWADIQRTRAQDPARNFLILSYVARDALAGHHCLVLVDLVLHAKLLARLLLARGIPAAAVTGAVSGPVRESLYGQMAQRTLVLIATKLADEGLDLPILDRLFVASAGRSEGRIEQQVGRIMRPHPGKGDAVAYDFADPSPGALVEQAEFREGTYGALGFPVRRVRGGMPP